MRDWCDVLKGLEGGDSMKRIVATSSTDKVKEKDLFEQIFVAETSNA